MLIAGLLLLQGGGDRFRHGRDRRLNPPSSLTPTELAADRTLGKSTAPVTLEVWSDFQCPVCGQFARTVEPALIAKYVTPGTLRIVHHDAAFQGAKSQATYDESVEAGRRRPVRRDPGPLLAVPGLDVRQPDRREPGCLLGRSAQGHRDGGRSGCRRMAGVRRDR